MLLRKKQQVKEGQRDDTAKEKLESARMIKEGITKERVLLGDIKEWLAGERLGGVEEADVAVNAGADCY